MNINNLNNDCLRKVFAYLSLNDILNLEFVCPRWKDVQQQLCERQTSIKLFGGGAQLTSFIRNESIRFNQLQCCTFFDSINDYLVISRLDWSICRLLVSKFPNLKMLVINNCHISKSVVLEFMICQWNQLRCLSLIHLIGNVEWTKVMDCLESLPKLKHLSLFGVEEELKLPTVLCHLEQFNFGRYEHSLLHVLVQLGVNIRQLGLYDSNLTLSCLTHAANSNSAIKLQLTHLAIKSDALKQTQAERNVFHFVCTNLLSLTTLSIYTEHGIRIEELVLELKQLVHLTELSLHAAEKSDLTSVRELRDYSFADQLDSIKILNLDIDIDPSTFEIVALLFANVRIAYINFARICCSCPEFPEVIDIPPLVQNPVPVVNDDNNLPPPPPPPIAQQAIPPPQPEEPRIFEEDNCESCSERAMLSLSSLKHLHKLGVTGARCKDSAIKALEQCKKLNVIVFACCVNYSLKHLLNVCYAMANQRKPQLIRVKINSDKFSKIIKLTQKPNNLKVENVDPIVQFEDCL